MKEQETVGKGHITNFIKNIINEDLATQKHAQVVTRFPPEPNGYLHIGHAKSICLNFGLSLQYTDSRCHLRFDDTNPEKEDLEYIESIKNDIHWLGYDWGQNLFHASDYFDQLYDFALELIKKGKAFVCDLTGEQMREFRGTLTEPGKNSPYRERSIEENLELFAGMAAGKFAEGSKVLRVKIDMASGNMNMRDPVIYRIKNAVHPVTGDKWKIYPMYDFTHCLSDAIEGITHSLCSLEFEDHRPLYNWFIENVESPSSPRQIEFARLELSYTVTSKRKLKRLVDEHHVLGWDDPRMPTISGLRRRGFTPKAIRDFSERVGVSKKPTTIDVSVLEECVRDDLNESAPRAFCILNPLKIELTNWQDGLVDLDVPNHPSDESKGRRKVPFGKELLIERDDFLEEPPSKFFRLAPGKEVRLRFSYVIKCEEVVKDEKSGEIIKLICSMDHETLGKKPQGRKVKGIIHWLSAEKAEKAEVRLYDRLFNQQNPVDAEKEGGDFVENLNQDSLQVIGSAYIEPSLKSAQPEDRFQFERLGYFCADKVEHKADNPIFNRIVSLRDSWNQGK